MKLNNVFISTGDCVRESYPDSPRFVSPKETRFTISPVSITKEDIEDLKNNFECFKKTHDFFDDDMLHYLLKEIQEKKAKEVEEKLNRAVNKMRRDRIKALANSIREVKFHDPYTIIFWKNGEVTRVKCQKGDTYDAEKGFAIALIKSIIGDNTSDFNTIFKKWIPEDK